MQILLQDMHSHGIEKLTIESRRNLLLKQSYLLESVPRFGSAMLNHSLNTASRRYEMRKRTNIEHERINALISTRLIQSRDQMKRYVDCVREATQPNACEELLRANQQVNNAINMSEFEIVREILENSGQGSIYVQADKLRQELNAAYLQQATIIGKCIEDIVQYSEVAKLYPNSKTGVKHRIGQYANWCELLINDPTKTACHQVISMFQQTFGHAVPRPAIDKEVKFAFQLYATWTAENDKLQKLNDHLQLQIELLSSHNQTELAIDMQKDDKLVYVGIEVLCNINKEMLLLENTASINCQTLPDATIVDREILLDKLRGLTNIAIHICESYSVANDNPILHKLHIAREFHESLRKIRQSYDNNIHVILWNGIVSEDASVMSMITSVLMLHQGPITIPERLTQLRFNNNNQEASTDLDDYCRKIRLDLAQLQENLMVEPETAGSRLYNDFWSIFETFDISVKQLKYVAGTTEIPEEFQSIDQVQEGTKLIVSLHNSESSLKKIIIYTILFL